MSVDQDYLLARWAGDASPTAPSWAKVMWLANETRALIVERDPVDREIEAELATGEVTALAGGTPLVRWLVAREAPLPSAVETIAIRETEPALLHALPGAAVARTFRRLVLVDKGTLAPVLEAAWPALAMLCLHDVTAASIEAMRHAPAIRRVDTLRLRGGGYPHPTALALAPLVESLSPAMCDLALDSLVIDAATAAALAAHQWPLLRELRLHDCRFEAGGEPLAAAQLPSLQRLDVARPSMMGPTMSDRALANLIANCPALQTLDCDGADVGELTAIAVATYGLQLERVNLGHARIGTAGARVLAESSSLGRLTDLALSGTFDFDTAHVLAASGTPAIARWARESSGALASVRSWAPKWPPADAGRVLVIGDVIEQVGARVDPAIDALEAKSLWPAAVPSVERWFGWQIIERCRECNGSGICPDGPCAWHTETVVHPPQRTRRPGDLRGVQWTAVFADAISAVETHAAQLLRTVGRPTQIEWWLGPEEIDKYGKHRAPRGLVERYPELRAVEYLDTDAWAHACARVRPDVFGSARAMVDAGVRIIRVDDNGVLVEPESWSLEVA